MEQTILEINNLNKIYPDGTNALKNIHLSINKGEFVVIIGLSGAGKSSLLRCINRLIEPSDGSVVFNGDDIVRAKGKKLRLIRRQIGMIFQHYNLIKRVTTVQNVLHGRLGYMSSIKGGLGLFEKMDVESALKLLERVGLLDQAFKRADELSGGQQQRVGISRAIAQNPALIMADEPIASLDPASSRNVMGYLRDICKEDGITAIVNLHQVEFAKEFADRIIGVKKGEIVFDGRPEQLTTEMTSMIYEGNVQESKDEPISRVL
ncbi:phosphonate ABC transporter ATP-binding protein [Evansella halocellulosilytica]|uniref:phosphonate ABC transporter ATP-binding protein n=1 Tax=Evansella halocellulosilytica TaxID=2011013 RepID=UPI000BB6ED44|nr:phosphonate ABC transporter ATP-binding protein [Evansella halocellulosilytica]